MIERGSSSLRPTDLLGLLAVVALGYAVPPFSRGLWNPDEPRVAHLGWEMARPGGDRVVPRVNGEPFLQEPPLAHWLVALCFRVTGTAAPGADWVPRMPSTLASLLTIILTAAAAFRLGGRTAGFCSALVLASAAEFLEIGNRAGTDVLSTFFVTVGALQVVAIAGEERLATARVVFLGLSTGLAFLAKNLLGPAFLAAMLVPVLVRRRELLLIPANWAKASLGAAAIAAVIVPWLVLLNRESPSSLDDLLLTHTFGRLILKDIHDPSFFEFAGRILLDLLPWTPLLFPAAWALRHGPLSLGKGAGAPSRATGVPDEGRSLALLSWIALPVLLILCSRSKRDLYLLSVYPAAAIVIGLWLGRIMDHPRTRKPAATLAVLLALPLPVAGLVGGVWAGPLPAAVFAAVAVHLFISYRWIRERGWRSPYRSVITAGLLLGLAITAGNLIRYRYQDSFRSYREFTRTVQSLEAGGFQVLGLRLGLKGVSTVAYCLGRTFPNLTEPGLAREALRPGAPPTALVVEGDASEADLGLPLSGKEAWARIDFPVKKGPLVVLLNRNPPAGLRQ